jgi:ABC-type branched-subunit amino acid transport system substrate-binding protein
MQRRNFVLAGSALFAGGLGGVLPASQAAQLTTIKFGQSASLSGGQASYGKDVRDGIAAAFAAASKADAAKGVRYELATLDDGGVKARCAGNVNQLIDGGATAIIGLTSGAGAEACMPAIDQAQIPLLGTASGNMGIRASNVNSAYHVRAGYDLEYQRMVAYVKDFGLRRVGVVYLQDTSKANMEAMNEALSAMGIVPKVAVAIDRNSASFDESSNTLMASKLDCVLFTANAAPVAAIIEQMSAAKYPGLFYASSFAGQDLIDTLTAKQRSCIMSMVVPRPNAMGVGVVAQCQRDLTAYDNRTRIGMTVLEGYIAGRIAVEAARTAMKAGVPVNRARMKEVLASLRADLGGYRVDFGAGPQGSRYVDLIAVDRYGRLVG